MHPHFDTMRIVFHCCWILIFLLTLRRQLRTSQPLLFPLKVITSTSTLSMQLIENTKTPLSYKPFSHRLVAKSKKTSCLYVIFANFFKTDTFNPKLKVSKNHPLTASIRQKKIIQIEFSYTKSPGWRPSFNYYNK